MKNIIELERERLIWSLETFKEATSVSSLRKLEAEIKEIEEAIDSDHSPSFEEISEEYADALMCLFDSAGRWGVMPEHIFEAFEKKLIKNKSRTWVKNPDNSYSHVKK